MTTIAARLTKRGARIAWDSQTTTGNTATHRASKVQLINNQFAVGVGGHVRYSNLVNQATLEAVHPYDFAQPDFDAYGWLIATLVPAWMKAVKDAWSATPKDDDYQIPWGVALVACPHGIYRISSDFAVVDLGEYGAIGSGGEFATTALHLGKSAAKAVEVASRLDLYTGGDISEIRIEVAK